MSKTKDVTAYSLLEIKEINDADRTITGIASTPATDRQEDIVEPMGAEFVTPFPFLRHHDSMQPVGHVIEAKPSKSGIAVKIKFVQVDSPPTLKERLDVAWMEAKTKLVRGLSIGFRPLEWSDIAGTWGRKFTKYEILELSMVTVPANGDCTMKGIQQVDRAARAALGLERPVVSFKDHLPKGSKSSPGASGSVKFMNPPSRKD